MATREIKDAKDLTTNELFYFKGHAQATFMSDGRTVEEAINDIDTSGGTSDLSNVVQYNGDGQAVLQNGTMYDGNTGISYALPSASDEDKGEADYVIATDVDLSDKQDKINDLDKIRSGAAKGATSAQQGQLQTGASAVVIPDGVFLDGGGSTYALPNFDETTKEAFDYVLASEAYVDSKLETIKILTETDPVLLYQGELENNGVYIINRPVGYLEIGNLAFSVHTNDFEKFTMIFTTKSSAIFDGVSFPADWQWANGVAPNVEKGVTYELSVTYIKFENSVKYNAILTPFKAV